MAEFAGYLKALHDTDTNVKIYIPGAGFKESKIMLVKGDLVTLRPTEDTFDYAISAESVVIQLERKNNSPTP